jgi:hypothetical protein
MSIRTVRRSRVAPRAAGIVAFAFIAMAATSSQLVHVTSTDASASFPSSAMSRDGELYVVWQDGRGPDDDVYGQAYARDGRPLWAPNGMLLVGGGRSQGAPVITLAGANGFILAWMDGRNGGADLYAQRFDREGQPLWQPSDGVPIAVTTAAKDDAKIVADGEGGCFIVWEDSRAGRQDIYGQHLTDAGEVTWSENGGVVCESARNQYDPFIALDGVGGVVVTWWDVSHPHWSVRAQRVSEIGARLWIDDGAPVALSAGSQAAPQIVGDTRGGAYVFWVDYRHDDGSYINFDIYSQHLGESGEMRWGDDGRALCSATGTQQTIAAVADGAGGAYIAWTDERDVYDDVYAQRLLADGSWGWTADGLPVSNARGRQRDPRLAVDGDSLLVAWYDYRRETDDETPQDLYWQRLNADGAPMLTEGGEPFVTDAGVRLAMATHVRDGRVAITWMDRRDATAGSDVHAWIGTADGANGRGPGPTDKSH